MDVTIDFDEADLAFLDDFATRHQLPSRSAAVSRAISMLRSFHLMPAYAAAFDE